PNSGQNMAVDLTSYYSAGSSKMVIVLPPTGGVNALDYKYAKAFCDAGLNAIILKSWAGNLIQTLDTHMHDQNTLRAVTSIRSLLSTIDTTMTIGIFGNSVGGITGALAIGLEDRITTGLFVVAGGGMSEIIAESSEQTLTELRAKRFKEFKFKD